MQPVCRTLPCAVLAAGVFAGDSADRRVGAGQLSRRKPCSRRRRMSIARLDTVKFLAGAALGLAHARERSPGLRRRCSTPTRAINGVHFGPFPFFAITHRGDLSPRREFAISSAGFWMQDLSSEWLLTTRPSLRDEHAPFAKGRARVQRAELGRLRVRRVRPRRPVRARHARHGGLDRRRRTRDRRAGAGAGGVRRDSLFQAGGALGEVGVESGEGGVGAAGAAK